VGNVFLRHQWPEDHLWRTLTAAKPQRASLSIRAGPQWSPLQAGLTVATQCVASIGPTTATSFHFRRSEKRPHCLLNENLPPGPSGYHGHDKDRAWDRNLARNQRTPAAP
jgi:hypothetical protein